MSDKEEISGKKNPDQNVENLDESLGNEENKSQESNLPDSETEVLPSIDKNAVFASEKELDAKTLEAEIENAEIQNESEIQTISKPNTDIEPISSNINKIEEIDEHSVEIDAEQSDKIDASVENSNSAEDSKIDEKEIEPMEARKDIIMTINDLTESNVLTSGSDKEMHVESSKVQENVNKDDIQTDPLEVQENISKDDLTSINEGTSDGFCPEKEKNTIMKSDPLGVQKNTNDDFIMLIDDDSCGSSSETRKKSEPLEVKESEYNKDDLTMKIDNEPSNSLSSETGKQAELEATTSKTTDIDQIDTMSSTAQEPIVESSDASKDASLEQIQQILKTLPLEQLKLLKGNIFDNLEVLNQKKDSSPEISDKSATVPDETKKDEKAEIVNLDNADDCAMDVSDEIAEDKTNKEKEEPKIQAETEKLGEKEPAVEKTVEDVICLDDSDDDELQNKEALSKNSVTARKSNKETEPTKVADEKKGAKAKRSFIHECINSNCEKKSEEFVKAPGFLLSYYYVNKKQSNQFVCGECFDDCVTKFEVK